MDKTIVAAVLLAVITTYWGHRIMSKLTAFAATLLASVAAQTTVVGSFVAFAQGQAKTIEDLHQQLRTALEQGNTEEALAVMDQLESAQKQITDNTGQLASAMAANTPSAAEVHQDLPGGVGTSDTVVDPAGVTLEPPVEPPLAAVEVEESDGDAGDGQAAGSGAQAGSEGTGDGSGSGTSEGGALGGGTQTGAGEDGGAAGSGELSGGPGRDGTAEAADGAGQSIGGDAQGDGAAAAEGGEGQGGQGTDR